MSSIKRQTSSEYPLLKPNFASFKRKLRFVYTKGSVCFKQTEAFITPNRWFSDAIYCIYFLEICNMERKSAYSCN